MVYAGRNGRTRTMGIGRALCWDNLPWNGQLFGQSCRFSLIHPWALRSILVMALMTSKYWFLSGPLFWECLRGEISIRAHSFSILFHQCQCGRTVSNECESIARQLFHLVATANSVHSMLTNESCRVCSGTCLGRNRDLTNCSDTKPVERMTTLKEVERKNSPNDS